MDTFKRRKIFCSLFLIVKDVIKLLADCLIATILCSICIENGWIFSYQTEITYELFWRLYCSVIILVPLIAFYRGFKGKYNINIGKANPPIGKALHEHADLD